ncbi:unnamed protein product [Caenorhabditis auriculariae]|uniref:EGF-like domain-containing protein n=1 Tax=Caenorhabditis auriculariae TaxID=2777116 RepID=A0A8S1HJF6_9PELO|nr:unnamed protein product [Caenorhabditis auriculariae]
MTTAELRPTYEITINKADGPRPPTKAVTEINKGASFSLKCSASKDFEVESLTLLRESVEKTVTRTGSSITYEVDSYADEHSGAYECRAKLKESTTWHTPQIRLHKPRVSVMNHLKRCDVSDTYCGEHGTCFLDNGRKLCECHGDYNGERCDSVLMTAFEGMANANYIRMIKMVGGATTGVNVVFIFLAIIFGVLYLKQKKKVRKMENYFGVLPERDPLYGEYPPLESLYKDCTQNGNTKKRPPLQKNYSFDESTHYGFGKLREAFHKAKLGKSDTKLLDRGGGTV